VEALSFSLQAKALLQTLTLEALKFSDSKNESGFLASRSAPYQHVSGHFSSRAIVRRVLGSKRCWGAARCYLGLCPSRYRRTLGHLPTGLFSTNLGLDNKQIARLRYNINNTNNTNNIKNIRNTDNIDNNSNKQLYYVLTSGYLNSVTGFLG
jgi:hypothetical protein